MNEFTTGDGDFFSLIPPDFGIEPADDISDLLFDLDHLLQCIRDDNDVSETTELIGCGATQDEPQDTKGLLCDSPEECPRGKRCISTPMPLVAKKAKRIKSDIVGSARPNLNHNQSRKRQQEERRYLRNQVQELANLLNRLLLEGQLCDAEGGSSCKAVVRHLDSMETQLQLALRKSALHQILSMKQAALQQQENLKNATMENRRLQALISECNQVVSSMEEEVRQHWSATPMYPSVSLLPTVGRVAGGPYFGGLGRELEVQYRRLSSVWKACGLASIRREEEIENYQIKH
uniref:Uncharacterized protein n=1 Tax=Globisporangium ultimum (strain ATCC 200006 / CBS 805.95 / DAOM BR144) TaxID=431595 RepID=K3W913_GLOUD